MGTEVETASVRHLAINGFPRAERVALAGANDRGDVRLRIDPVIVAECKRAQRGVLLTPWMKELDTEAYNSGARYGLLIAKQRGAGERSVGRWFTAMREWHYRDLVNHVTLLQPSVDPMLMQLQNLSPMHVNNGLVPSLNHPKSRSKDGTWPWMPFASTFTPGYLATGGRMVLGPLNQFLQLLEWASLTETATEEAAT